MIVISMFVLSTTNRAHQRCVVQINPIKYAAPALLEVIVLPFFPQKEVCIYMCMIPEVLLAILSYLIDGSLFFQLEPML